MPRKQNMILPYSADNDLDVFRLSAQMSVLSKEKIGSVGELEGRIAYTKTDYESQRAELNAIIEEHNKLSTLLEQANTYYRLAKKEELSEAEQLQKTMCRKAMESNGILYRADHDQLRNKVERLTRKISDRKEKLDEVQKKYAVYRDILETFFQVSKDEYITKLEEEERQRKEELNKKKKKTKR